MTDDRSTVGAEAPGHTSYEADIAWTTHGVAHVRAASWGDLGFGQGWACARDNIGTICDMVLKVRGERAAFHGRGGDDNYLASDFGYRSLGLDGRARALRDAQSPTARALIDGYRAGCNAWLAEAQRTGALPAWCAAAAWVRPLDELDLYRYLVDAVLLASGRNLVALIGRAEAPGPDGPVEASPMSALQSPAAASNGWAFGSAATASGGGLVMANPHFPWHGEARFWECHLTIPGELDVYGVSLIGIPGVQIGFNAHVGWTHTFSRGSRFTLSRLDLVPGDPTRYRFGDDERAMTAQAHTVAVRGEDPVTRTLWHTHQGPMVNLPLLGWSEQLGFTYRDANLDNTGMVEMYLGMGRARDLDEFRAAIVSTQAMPWANTLAADSTGRAWYADLSATPKLSAAAEQRYRTRLATDPIAALLAENRVALLDGSDPDDEWVELDGARTPGTVPVEDLPELWRDDLMVNANDPHWCPHPEVRLEGFPVLCGLERTALSLRTRQNLAVASALAEGGALDVDAALDAVLDNATLTDALVRRGVVARCRAAADSVAQQVADVLDAWDGTMGLEARGAALWRELLAGFSVEELRGAGRLFAVDFDPDDPLHTPRDLAAANASEPDPVVAAAVAAWHALGEAGVDPAAPLGAHQWARVGDERLAVAGGGEVEGIANVLAPLGALAGHSLAPAPPAPEPVPDRVARTGLGQGGYQVTYGTSFLMAVELTSEGPHAKGILAYGQSDDPDDPRTAACVRAYAAGELRTLCFTDAQIEADAALERRRVTGT